MLNATPHCFRLDRQVAARAFERAWAKTGKRIAAKIAMIAITTSNSMSVKAFLRRGMSSSPFTSDCCTGGLKQRRPGPAKGVFARVRPIPSRRGENRLASRMDAHNQED